jgi:hypothetical protein
MLPSAATAGNSVTSEKCVPINRNTNRSDAAAVIAR